MATEKQRGDGFLAGLVAVLVLSAAAGGLTGLMLAPGPAAPTAGAVREAAPAVASAAGEAAAQGRENAPPPDTRKLVTLRPILTNIAEPSDVWLRMEAALLVEDGTISEAQAAEAAQDMMTFLRSLKLDQLQGAGALLFLREDLLDRINIRLDGRARELLISTMVVE